MARTGWILRFVASLAAFLVVMEVLCWLAIGRITPLRVDSRFDKITKPHEVVVQSFEGFSRSRTNELGNLDEPMPATLPTDGILVVGDSYTEARQVAPRERFTDRLAAMLGRRVYNAGHAGWSPLNALAYAGVELQTFKPATVVVQVSGKDLADIVMPKRGHIVERDGTFAIEWPKREKQGIGKKITQARELVSHSAFASQLISSTVGLFGGKDDGGAEGTCEMPTPLALRALPWLFDQLARVHRDVRVVYIPKLDYHGGCIDQCEFARGLYQVAARRAGVPFIDPTAAMCARFAATRDPLHGFWNTIPGTGHINSEGHEVVAEQLAANLRR